MAAQTWFISVDITGMQVINSSPSKKSYSSLTLSVGVSAGTLTAYCQAADCLWVTIRKGFIRLAFSLLILPPRCSVLQTCDANYPCVLTHILVPNYSRSNPALLLSGELPMLGCWVSDGEDWPQNLLETCLFTRNKYLWTSRNTCQRIQINHAFQDKTKQKDTSA